mmetsp:Transcript_93321/g.267600  ORF Transcript_93321/g.267600 Transcript_93321/m.267600 type:complete len:386 (-) Transcript_93321:67-1224(-)
MEGVRGAVRSRPREVHRLRLPVEGGVVESEEGHAQDPNGSVLRVHVHLHEGGHAHVDLLDLGFEEELLPDAVLLLDGLGRDTHHVGLRGQREVGAVDVEVQGREQVHVRAVLHDGLELGAELLQRLGRGGDEGGAAVDYGGATTARARDVGEVVRQRRLAEGDVVHARNPVVLADHTGTGIVLLLVLGGDLLAPGHDAVGPGSPLKADRELLDAEVHEQGLVLVAVGKVRADAHDGSELSSVEHLDFVVDDFPEGLAFRLQRANVDLLVALHGDAWTRAEDVLCQSAILPVRLAMVAVVRNGGMHAVAAAGRAHQQFERARVENALDLLASDCEVPVVLHVHVVVQSLPVDSAAHRADRGRDFAVRDLQGAARHRERARHEELHR